MLRVSDCIANPRVLLNFFTVIFYGLEKFGRKNAQFPATRRKCWPAGMPSVRNGAQAGENGRKNSSLN
jgi:hypothetical protein